MATYALWDIQELPLGIPMIRRKVEAFLETNGLRLEAVDAYFAIESPEGRILAGGGYQKDILKCIAVAEPYRSEGLMAPIVSRLLQEVGSRQVKVFTKPENRAVFESLGFHLLASAPKAILMETGAGLEAYCRYLEGFRRPGKVGAIVLNANPFTLGHRYLIEKALKTVDRLFLIPVREENPPFSYAERVAMIRAGVEKWGEKVVVLEGSDYQISAATFPSYFLKEPSDAAETQMRLDLDLFSRHIAPALGASVRFVGSEPADALTARYNRLMKRELGDINLVEIPRLKGANGRFVTASRVRKALEEGRLSRAAALTPASDRPYLLAALAERALRLEAEAPLKPGLVCPEGPGAHRDMDLRLMQKGIAAIRPYFPAMVLSSDPDALRQLGIEAEAAMLRATGGVNTHRGAIFAFGLALRSGGNSRKIARLAKAVCGPLRTPGARENALGGYLDVFAFGLPYYRDIQRQPYALQRLLCYYMATLTDSCVLHRGGAEKAEALKSLAAEAFEALHHESDAVTIETQLRALCRYCEKENLSPGGAADLLALTIFIDSINA